MTLYKIGTGTLSQNSLAGQAAVVTGAGRGIGYETARSLLWLGAQVVLAEIDAKTGKAAAEQFTQEFGPDKALFIRTDVGDEGSISRLKRQALKAFGKIDIVINNATATPLGGVLERAIRDWDRSYAANLRGPVLLAQAFLPDMIKRNYGVFMCVSSVGGKYMGAYETFKTAQVELARTLEAELEGTGVIVFTIGPGIVRTPGALEGIRQIAPLYGKSVEEFFEDYKDQLITVEEAGAGFAAAAALADRFRGMEIGAPKALAEAGIFIGAPVAVPEAKLDPEKAAQALALCKEVRQVLVEQSDGWMKRPLFERQWMLRDFKQNSGIPLEDCRIAMQKLENSLQENNLVEAMKYSQAARQVARFYAHYQKLAEGNEKDPAKREAYSAMIQDWREKAQQLTELLGVME